MSPSICTIIIPIRGLNMKKVYMRQKVWTMVNAYKLEDENQNPIYTCEGHLFSWRSRMSMFDSYGKTIFKFERRYFHFYPTIHVEDVIGDYDFIIKRKFGFRPRLIIEGLDASFAVIGNIWGFDFEITENNAVIARVSKKIWSWADTYEMTILKEKHSDFLAALLVAIDVLVHNSGKY